MKITRTNFNGVTRTLDLNVTQKQIDLYEEGNTLLQDCFPNLPRDQREFIKSGCTQEDWDEMFKEVEEFKTTGI